MDKGSSEERRRNRRKERRRNELAKQKALAKEIENDVLDDIEKEPSKIGVILCEGNQDSIDVAVYGAVFPDFVVYPVGSCTVITRLLQRVRRRLAAHQLYAYGIIDRDGLSKSEIRHTFLTVSTYTTKLPFIENIICTPEVLKLVCQKRGIDYTSTRKRIQAELVKFLWRHLKETLPINIGIQKWETIESISFVVKTKKQQITKKANHDSILYVYRDKAIVGIVSNAIGLGTRLEYYALIKEMLQEEEYREALVRRMSKFIPKLEEYELIV